jgi:hypothetical protein
VIDRVRLAEVVGGEAFAIITLSLKQLAGKRPISDDARLSYTQGIEAQAHGEEEIAASYFRATAHHLDRQRLLNEEEEHRQWKQQFVASALAVAKALAPLLLAAV